MRNAVFALVILLVAANGALAAPADPPPFGQSRFPVCGAAVDPGVPVCREAAPLVPTLPAGASVRLDGDRLLIAYLGEAKSVQLAGELVPEPMPSVGDKRWLRVLRIAHPEAINFHVGFVITPEAGAARYEQVAVTGPAYVAPPVPRGSPVQKMSLDSKHMNGKRILNIWLSPNYSATTPAHVIYLADGMAHFGFRLAARMAAGDLPPLVVVALEPCNADAPPIAKAACRNHEYQSGWVGANGDPSAFLAHETFFIEEVIPTIERTFNVSRRPADRAVAGYSSGADWAASMAARHPTLLSYAIVMSPSRGVYDVLPATPALPAMNITAGLFEPDMVRGSACLAGTLAQAGAAVRVTTMPFGHSTEMWQQVFAARVLDWLAGTLPPATPGLVRAPTCWPRAPQPA